MVADVYPGVYDTYKRFGFNVEGRVFPYNSKGGLLDGVEIVNHDSTSRYYTRWYFSYISISANKKKYKELADIYYAECVAKGYTDLTMLFGEQP